MLHLHDFKIQQCSPGKDKNVSVIANRGIVNMTHTSFHTPVELPNRLQDEPAIFLYTTILTIERTSID